MRLAFSPVGIRRPRPRKGGRLGLSDKKVGESIGDESKRKKAPEKRAPKKRPTKRGNDVGRALRSAYDETLREEVPDDFLDLLGKLS